MSFEYLIVGIARGQEEDYREFYDKTKVEAYMFALSMVKDRVIARDIAVEAYRRVRSLAYKFDTDLNAEYWLLDIVKNLSVNSLRHAEIKNAAEAKRADTLTHLISDLIFYTREDRAKFIVLRTASDLKKSEISRLLWYKSGSASAEYRRGIKELLDSDPAQRSKSTIKNDLFEDMTSCTPDMWGLVIKDEDTRVSFVSHEELDIDDEEVAFSEDAEEVLEVKRAADRKKRKVKILTVALAVVLVCALVGGIIAAVVAYNKEQNKKALSSDSGTTIDVTMPQFGTSIAMAELDGVLYYANYADGGKLYKADFTSGTAVTSKLSDDVPREIVVCDSENKYVIYRNNADGKIYRYSPQDGAVVKLCEISGAALCVSGDVLYFSSPVGISAISVTGDASTYKEVLVKHDSALPFRYDIETAEDGLVYFSSGADGGIYVLSDYTNEDTDESYIYNEGVYAGYVYDMHLYDGDIYFDISENNSSVLCKIDTENDNKVSRIENVYLSSAAISVRDGYIYYAGYAEDPEKNENAQRGLFRVSVEGGTPEMLVVQADEMLHISDLYVSDSRIYSYSCTADAKSARKLISYDKEGLNKDNYASKSAVVFE